MRNDKRNNHKDSDEYKAETTKIRTNHEKIATRHEKQIVRTISLNKLYKIT